MIQTKKKRNTQDILKKKRSTDAYENESIEAILQEKIEPSQTC